MFKTYKEIPEDRAELEKYLKGIKFQWFAIGVGFYTTIDAVLTYFMRYR